MIILQITTDTAQRIFDTNPTTVYGILVFLLVSAVGALWVQSNRRYGKQMKNQAAQYESYIDKLVELNVSCVETLSDLSNNLERLRDAGVNMTDDLRREITNTREHIIEKLNNLAQNQKNEASKKT